MRVILLTLSLGVFVHECPGSRQYLPDWGDLDSRPAPKWYDSSKIGIFVHWGPYAVPCYSSEWFWFDLQNGDERIKSFMGNNSYNSYLDFPPLFTAESFDPDKWAQLFADAGARYVVLTSKHHDGFALFPSGRSNWNSVDVGPKRDIVDELSKSVRKLNMKFGVYYSLYEWFNKLYSDDDKRYFTTTSYTDSVVWPDIKYLINQYKPSILWSDGDRDASCTYWKSRELLAWLYNDSPVKDEIVVNDRWGYNCWCKHGDFYNCDDGFNPGYLMPHKWEDAFKLDKLSWGCRNDIRDDQMLTLNELLSTIVIVVSCGGNALINVGPTKEGIIPEIFEELLLQLGQWLKIYGEAIYDTSPWKYQNDSVNRNVWYTCKKKHTSLSNSTTNSTEVTHLYAFFLKWPYDNVLQMGSLAEYFATRNSIVYVELIEANSTTLVRYSVMGTMVKVDLPPDTQKNENYVWALRITFDDELESSAYLDTDISSTDTAIRKEDRTS